MISCKTCNGMLPLHQMSCYTCIHNSQLNPGCVFAFQRKYNLDVCCTYEHIKSFWFGLTSYLINPASYMLPHMQPQLCYLINATSNMLHHKYATSKSCCKCLRSNLPNLRKFPDPLSTRYNRSPKY